MTTTTIDCVACGHRAHPEGPCDAEWDSSQYDDAVALHCGCQRSLTEDEALAAALEGKCAVCGGPLAEWTLPNEEFVRYSGCANMDCSAMYEIAHNTVRGLYEVTA